MITTSDRPDHRFGNTIALLHHGRLDTADHPAEPTAGHRGVPEARRPYEAPFGRSGDGHGPSWDRTSVR